jgi:HlyD family secretion protein
MVNVRALNYAFCTTALTSMVCLCSCTKESAQPEPEVSVQVAPVKQGSISQVVTTDAVLFPVNQATIVPKITAPVLKAHVIRGSKVHQGQLLITLENSELAAAVQENRGNLEQVQAAREIAINNSLPEELQKAELDAQFAKENLDAQQKIYESRKSLLAQGAIPRKDFDTANVAFVQAKVQYEQAQKHLNGLKAIGHQQSLKSANAQLISAEGKFKGAEAQLRYSEIRSPIDGVVTDGPWYPGVVPQAGAPLITVMDLSRMIAKAHIPHNQASLLKKGDEATLRVSGLDEPVAGRVALVSPALDPGSTTVEVWVEAPNPKGLLKAGASAILTITAKTVSNALLVPAQSVLTDEEGKKSVMVVGEDRTAVKREVDTGIQTSDSVQIVSGLKVGERVVGTGAYGLPDKSKIKVEAAPPAEEEQKQKDKEQQGS